MKSVHNLNVPLNKCKSLSCYKIIPNVILKETKAGILHKPSAGGRMSGMSGFKGSRDLTFVIRKGVTCDQAKKKQQTPCKEFPS